MPEHPNILFFHVDNLGFGELTCDSGGPFRGATTERDECLWPDDPWYDPERDPVSRMLEIRCGDSEATEREQLTMDVRRGCDIDYLRRAEAFIRGSVADRRPFFVYFNHGYAHARHPTR